MESENFAIYWSFEQYLNTSWTPREALKVWWACDVVYWGKNGCCPVAGWYSNSSEYPGFVGEAWYSVLVSGSSFDSDGFLTPIGLEVPGESMMCLKLTCTWLSRCASVCCLMIDGEILLLMLHILSPSIAAAASKTSAAAFSCSTASRSASCLAFYKFNLAFFFPLFCYIKLPLCKCSSCTHSFSYSSGFSSNTGY